MADINVNEVPAHWEGPVSKVQLLPALSLKPLMLTGKPFHTGCEETKAISVDAPTELNGAVVWDASAVVLMYPVLLTTAGVDVCAEAGTEKSIPSDPIASSNLQRKYLFFIWLSIRRCKLLPGILLYGSPLRAPSMIRDNSGSIFLPLTIIRRTELRQ